MLKREGEEEFVEFEGFDDDGVREDLWDLDEDGDAEAWSWLGGLRREDVVMMVVGILTAWCFE